MNISCDIIRDLLPLYAEDMVSEDSKKLVDAHLCKCDECAKEFVTLKKPQKVPVETDVSSLKRVEVTIRRKKTLTVLTALMTVAALYVTVMTWMLTPYTLTAEEAIEGVWLTEDGFLAIDYSRGIISHASQAIFDSDNEVEVCNTNRYDWYEARKIDAMLEDMTEEEIKHYIAELYEKRDCTEKDWNRFFNIYVNYGLFKTHDGQFLHEYDPEIWIPENGEWTNRPTDRNQWYIDPNNGDVDMLLWDAGLNYPDSILWMTSRIYGYVFFGCLILATLFYWISRGITGIWKEVLPRVTIILISIACSTLLVTGGQFRTLEYHMSPEWNEAIYMESLVLSLTFLLWYQLNRLNRLDKPM